MLRPKTIIIGILLLPFVLFMLEFIRVASVAQWLKLQGFYVNTNPSDLAKIAAKEGSASACLRLRRVDSYIQIAPVMTEGSDQWSCIYLTAEFLLDARPCELLIPDEYGLGCVANIWGKITDEVNCHWISKDDVRCFQGEDLVPKMFHCDSVSTGLPDECFHRIAFEKKDPAICNRIVDPRLRGVCEMRINAWLKYPELRSSMYFGWKKENAQ